MDKAVDIGVYCVDSQAPGFFLHEMSSMLPYMGQDYEQNWFDEKHGRVRLNIVFLDSRPGETSR